jgi:hypothetical protein
LFGLCSLPISPLAFVWPAVCNLSLDQFGMLTRQSGLSNDFLHLENTAASHTFPHFSSYELSENDQVNVCVVHPIFCYEPGAAAKNDTFRLFRLFQLRISKKSKNFIKWFALSHYLGFAFLYLLDSREVFPDEPWVFTFP